MPYRRILSAVAVLTAAALAGVAFLSPGSHGYFPLKWLRSSPREFPRSEIEHNAETFGNRPSYLVSMRGNRSYHAGRSSRVFYLGDDSTFHARLLIQDFGGCLATGTVRFFLNYSPAVLDIDGASAIPRTSTVSLALDRDAVRILGLTVHGIAPGVNDFCLEVRTTNHMVLDREPGRHYPLVPRNVHTFQLIRNGRSPRPDHAVPSKEMAPGDCPRPERAYLAKDNRIAIVNCTDSVAQGVLFGGTVPRFYRVEPHRMAVFEHDDGDVLLHLADPFTALETWNGRARYPQSDILGL